MKLPSKTTWGYIIPALFLIGGGYFLFSKSSSAGGVINSYIGKGYKNIGYFDGGKAARDLDVRAIRWSSHHGYERVVFDIYKWHGVFDTTPYKATSFTGLYQIGKEEQESRHLDGEILGYRAFTAKLPSFTKSKLIEKMQIIPNEEDSYYFTFTLKKPVAYKVFTLKHPTRIVIDIK